MTTSHPESSIGKTAGTTTGGWRALVEVLVCLYIAVILFRTFEVEGYIISTGSMAPTLLGYHKRVVCPSCGYTFAFGIPVDAPRTTAKTGDASSRSSSAVETSGNDHSRLEAARCPNCGQDPIDIGELPPNQGDQLLVLKNVYDLRPPRRWEVVVLSPPMRPMPPFVKRIVGLPEEAVQIIDGDIWADGKICRKDLAQQRAVRIPVFDNSYRPAGSAAALGCWSPEPSPNAWHDSLLGRGMVADKNSRGFAVAQQVIRSGDEKASWLAFHHQVRRGGTHQTSVDLGASAADVRLPAVSFPSLQIDRKAKRLVCTGALPWTQKEKLLALNRDPSVREAIQRLDELSHQAPVTDEYGYNRPDGSLPLPVGDLMIECDVASVGGQGELTFEISDGSTTFQLTFDRTKNVVRLSDARQRETPLQTAPFASERFERPFKVELSTFDRQVLAAVDGELLFPEWDCKPERGPAPRTPARIGARGLSVELSALKVYRDIYYSRGPGRHAVDAPILLGSDEYFVLGDNSPVSSDGRAWPQGAVKESQLIGKPLCVHLPSRPAGVNYGGKLHYIRIPDFSRMRYIR